MSYRLINSNNIPFNSDGFISADDVIELPCIYADLPNGLDEQFYTVIPTYKEMTNGDMIKAMFPNIEIEGIGGEIKCIAAKGGTSYFALDWWNAPYKKGENQ